MNNQQLKAAIASDIGAIRTLNPDIIPAGRYYGAILQGVFGVFIRFFLIMTVAFAWSFAFNSKTTAPVTFWDATSSGAILALLLGIPATLLLLWPVNYFVLFRFHLEDRLETGKLVVRKLKHIAHLYFGIFAGLCFLSASYASDMQILFLLVFSFFVSLGVTHLMVGMELNRIGVSTIFAAINAFFDKRRDASLNQG